MRCICLIPARYDASRFKGKLLQVMDDKKGKQKTVIRETYERMSSYGIFDDVMVVTNSELIKKEMNEHQGKVVYIPNDTHKSGTDRIAEAAKELEADVIFNIQGDEPFIARKPLEELIALMKKNNEPLAVASLMKRMDNQENINSSDYVKVVFDKNYRALYFSRSVIPYPKNNVELAKYYEHVGVYAFTREALFEFVKLAPSVNELVESVECLRFTENGLPISMIETDTFLIEIDTPADLKNVNNLLEQGVISLV